MQKIIQCVKYNQAKWRSCMGLVKEMPNVFSKYTVCMQSRDLVWVLCRTWVLSRSQCWHLNICSLSLPPNGQAIWVHLQDTESTVPSTTWHKHAYIITYPHLNHSQLRACPSDFII